MRLKAFVIGFLAMGAAVSAAHARGMTECTMKYNLKGWSAFYKTAGGAGTIRGELYSFEDLPAALDVLDDVEEFDPANPEGSEFVRDARRVRRDDGTELSAWVYVYNQPRGSAPIIPSGDWRKQS